MLPQVLQPIVTSGDGNCIFNALSLTIAGHCETQRLMLGDHHMYSRDLCIAMENGGLSLAVVCLGFHAGGCSVQDTANFITHAHQMLPRLFWGVQIPDLG